MPTPKGASHDNPRLPLGPFREWLLRQEAAMGSKSLVAAWIGKGSKRVDEWMRSPDLQSVTLDTVDSVGVAIGDVTLLRQLYPSVYDLPEWLAGDEERVA